MRSLQRKLQDVWICDFEEINVGVNRVKMYKKPKKYRMTVSATSGLILGWGAGLALRYDRFMTCFDRSVRGEIKEGQMCFIDVKPVFDRNGELSADIWWEGYIDSDEEEKIVSVTYESEPDYIIERILDTEKGNVARYGIRKV